MSDASNSGSATTTATVSVTCILALASGHTHSGTGSGGSGVWDTSTANWFNGTTDVTWSNANNATAYFDGGSAGSVTINTAITAQVRFDFTGIATTSRATTR